MADHTPKEVERIEEKAKRDEKDAERAREVVNDVIRTTNPQRQINMEDEN